MLWGLEKLTLRYLTLIYWKLNYALTICFKIQYELNSARWLQTRGDMAENEHGLSALGDTKVRHLISFYFCDHKKIVSFISSGKLTGRYILKEISGESLRRNLLWALHRKFVYTIMVGSLGQVWYTRLLLKSSLNDAWKGDKEIGK